MTSLSLKIKTVKSNLKIQYIEKSTIWGTNNYKVFKSYDWKDSWKEIIQIDTSPLTRLLSRIKLIKRLLRLGIQSILIVNDKVIVTTHRTLYCQKGEKLKKIKSFEHGGPLRQGLTKDQEGNIYYGEYFDNPNRKEVFIYKSKNSGQDWKKFYAFNPGEIRHIHAVQFDAYKNILWVATGDKDSECKLIKINPKTKESSVIGQGEQKWRTVSLIFTKDKVYWGTDKPKGDNTINELDRKTQKIRAVAKSKNPFYYSTTTKDYLIYATTVEKNKKGDKKWSKIFASKNGKKWKVIFKVRKDKLPAIFSYGLINFPINETSANNLLFTPTALKKFDNKLIIGKITEKNE